MTEIQDVVGTAFIVAEYRGREDAEQDPLYRDTITRLFLSNQTREAADRVAAGFPPGRQGVRLRTRYFDDRLDEELDRGCRQVVILGAGLDARGIRKQVPDVTYFEIDDASILNFKQARLAEAGIGARVVFIPGNYIVDDTLRLLAANGFDFNLPTYIIWEGNTMYLSRPTVLKVLTDLRSSLGEFAVSFDYVTEAVIAYETGDERLSSFVKRFADMGAPWNFGIDDLDTFVNDAGLRVVDNVEVIELFRTFWPNRQIDSKFYNNYGLCTLAAQLDT
jgi:methyltransferase (TIGR00027 family)